MQGRDFFTIPCIDDLTAVLDHSLADFTQLLNEEEILKEYPKHIYVEARLQGLKSTIA